MSEDKLTDPKYTVIITGDKEVLRTADLGLDTNRLAEEELHGRILDGLKELFPGATAREFKKLKNDWDKLNEQTRELLASAEKETPAGFRLDEISFSVGISAKGNIGLVGAGANAGIVMKFRRTAA